ncbi:MAG: hypothetical protein EU541_02015 [Promethearchaeota archaeon]|nr:MAG: hypothetical protein EU541_02015 [Candidatus Lokiarchaeota archaeon]
MGLFSKEKEIGFDEKRKKENLKILKKSDRLKEAIAYTYLIYGDLMKEKYKKPRRIYQTIREYAIICVNECGVQPSLIYPFVKRVEDIIYGGKEPTEQEFQNTLNTFSKLYSEIMGKEFNLSG